MKTTLLLVDIAYTTSSCTSTANLGRYIEDKYGSEPAGYIFEVGASGVLIAHVCP